MKKKTVLLVLTISCILTACGGTTKNDKAEDLNLAITSEELSKEEASTEEISTDEVAAEDSTNEASTTGDSTNEASTTKDSANEASTTEGSTSEAGAVEDVATEEENIFFKDYTNQIEKEVADIVSNSATLQDELSGITKLADKYDALRTQATTQSEMSTVSKWTYVVWDTELNNLWKRMNDALDADTKSKLLEQQRHWIALKEKVIAEALADYQEGSIYPMLANEADVHATRNRTYLLASIFAETKKEPFTLPKMGETLRYIDNQDTDSVYSALYIQENMAGELEAFFSVDGMGQATGSVEFLQEGGGNTIAFQCDDYDMTARITYDSNGAKVEIVEANEGPFQTGEIYEFPLIF